MLIMLIMLYINNIQFFKEGNNSDSLLSLCHQLGINILVINSTGPSVIKSSIFIAFTYRRMHTRVQLLTHV